MKSKYLQLIKELWPIYRKELMIRLPRLSNVVDLNIQKIDIGDNPLEIISLIFSSRQRFDGCIDAYIR